MNCEDFESNVNDLAREQIIEASVRAQALAHRDECEVCARRLEDEGALSFKLRALAADTNAVAVPALGNGLLTALRGRQPAMARSTEAASWPHRTMLAAAMAVAAMVLVVIAVTVIRSYSTTPAAQNQPHPVSPESPPPSENAIVKAPNLVKPLPNNQTLEGRKDRRHRVKRTVVPSQSIAGVDSKDVATVDTTASVASDSATEITTDFIPVGYTSTTSLQDGGQLVRVELPRSALVAFGLPMNFNRYDEKVKADVFFGMDGMARAIRFVQ
jgi:hypothetical protein